MSKPILSSLDFGGVARILNLPDGVGAQEPATVAQLNASLEGLAWKDNVKVATGSNVSVASPGATVDGVAMTAGDRVLLRAQTTASENGIYLWNGSAVPMTRALDMNASTEFNSAVTTADAGSNAGSSFRQTAVSPTVGTTAIAWVSFGIAASAASTASAGVVRLALQSEADTGTDATIAITPATMAAFSGKAKRFAASFGDGSATQYDLTHALGTLDVVVQVKRVSDGVVVGCDIAAISTTVVRLNFAIAPTSNQYRCTVLA